MAARPPRRSIPRLVGGGLRAGAYLVPKAATFSAALILSNQIGLREYGQFEYAMSWASVLAVPATFGITGAIPYFAMKLRRLEVLDACFVHAIVLILGSILASVGFYAGIVPIVGYLGALIVTILALQSMSSTRLKVNQKPITASTVESGIYISLLCVVGVIWSRVAAASIRPVFHGLELYLGALVGMTVVRAPKPHRGLFAHYRELTAFGFPLIFSSLFMLLFITAARISAGAIISVQAAALYGFMWRLSAPVILLHQVIGAFWFRQLYESTTDELDRRFALVAGVVAVCAAGSFLLCPVVLERRLVLMHEVRTNELGTYLAVCAQMVMWVAIASLEGIVVRERAAPKLAALLFATTAGFFAVAALWWKLGWLSLGFLSRAHLVAMACVVAGQLVILLRAGLRFPRLMKVLAAAGGAYGVGEVLVLTMR